MLFEGGTLLLLSTILIPVGDITCVKSHARWASAHRRALVQRALKAMDAAESD
jgi:hypothetical protein